MSSLEDDIARIAALRGRRAEDYTDVAVARRHPLPGATLATIEKPGPGAADDVEACDRLPPRSREFIRNHPHALNARAWEGALLSGFSEEQIIRAIAKGT
jgi:hypothetical protein